MGGDEVGAGVAEGGGVDGAVDPQPERQVRARATITEPFGVPEVSLRLGTVGEISGPIRGVPPEIIDVHGEILVRCAIGNDPLFQTAPREL